MIFDINNISHKTKLKVLFLILITTLTATILVLFRTERSRNEITISGINTIQTPSDRKEAISKALYNVLLNNLPPNKKIAINDAVIRDRSYIDNYDSHTDVHNASFIIDIQSIRQSYIVYFEWSDKIQNSNISGYTATIQCLPKSQLKYGHFDCKPTLTSSDTKPPDIINRYLPYHVESKFMITGARIDNNTGLVSLTIEAYLPRSMSKVTPELLSTYSTEIQTWIKSKGLDSDNYYLDFVY